MPYPATVFNVMVASPSDVQNERIIIRDIINEWNIVYSRDRKIVLQMTGWETHSTPAVGDRPQEIINNQLLRHADLLIAVFWTRFGTPTGVAASGTIEEIEEHLNAQKPAMIYFSSQPVRLDSVDESQYSALKEFKSNLQQRGLYETYNSISEFTDKIRRHLSQAVIEHFVVDGGNVADEPTSPRLPKIEISKPASELLVEAVGDQSGRVLRLKFIGGMRVRTNGREFVTEANARIHALWEDAVNELAYHGLIEDCGDKGEVFRVTTQGYEIADDIRENLDGE